MSLNSDKLDHATQLDLSIAGTAVMRLTSTGVEQLSGKNKNWFTYVGSDGIAVGGGGALAAAVLNIGSFRKYNAWELPNGATDPYLDINFWLPPDYDGGSLLVTLYLAKTATATGTDVVTRVRLATAGAGDSLDVTLSSPVNVTDTVGSNDALFVATHTLTPASPTAGEVCHGIVQRVPTNAADDYTGSIYLLGARVEYS